MQTVAETPTFSRQADKIFSQDERRELIEFLARIPLAGDEIPGTGGVRKLDSPPPGVGNAAAHGSSTITRTKRCRSTPLLAYAKARKVDLTPNERRAVSALAAAIKAARTEKT